MSYRLHSAHGGDLGVVGKARRFRVLDLVPFEKDAESPLMGLLRIEPTDRER